MKSHRKTERERARKRDGKGIRDRKTMGTERGMKRRDAVISEHREEKLQNRQKRYAKEK